MSDPRLSFDALKEALRRPHVFPGGYPLHVLMADGECLCIDCARKNFKRLISEKRRPCDPAWKVYGVDVNWESLLYCAHCNEQIESAYEVIDHENT